MGKKHKLKRFLKVRSYTGGEKIVSIWLIESEGGVEQWLMFGEISTAKVQEIIDWFKELNVDVTKEKSPLPGKSMFTAPSTKKQAPKGLF